MIRKCEPERQIINFEEKCFLWKREKVVPAMRVLEGSFAFALGL